MLGTSFASLTPSTAPDLYPAKHAAEIDTLNKHTYELLNNCVYRAGFAQSQRACEEVYQDVFTNLDEWEERLSRRGYLITDRKSETDIRVFVALVRLDAAYHELYKCNRRQISDYQNLSAYVKRIYSLPGVAESVNLKHIKHGYYNLKNLNTLGIVPQGPDIDFT